MTVSAIHSAMMIENKKILSKIYDALPKIKKSVFVDYPVHFNIGDLLIQLGAEAFFSDYKVDIAARFTLNDLGHFDRTKQVFHLGRYIKFLDELVQAGCAIFMHGGGNMGDIWPEHQLLREQLIARYPDATIIIMPQSIQFHKQETRERAVSLMAAHKGLHLFVRDIESSSFAADACPGRYEVTPDMAHQLWETEIASVPTSEGSGTLYQVRRDLETSGVFRQAEQAAFDWDDLIGFKERLLLKNIQARSWINAFAGGRPPHKQWYALTEDLVQKAKAVFVPRDRVVTDRLHGMIFSCLLQKKVAFADNSYGKNSRYYKRWLADSDLVTPLELAASEAAASS